MSVPSPGHLAARAAVDHLARHEHDVMTRVVIFAGRYYIHPARLFRIRPLFRRGMAGLKYPAAAIARPFIDIADGGWQPYRNKNSW